jgi:hypothetical protein
MYEVPTIDSGSNWADIRIGDTVLYFSYRTWEGCSLDRHHTHQQQEG